MEREKSVVGSAPKENLGARWLRNCLAFWIHSSHFEDVAFMTAVEKTFMKSASERHGKVSICATLMSLDATMAHTLSTSEVLPMRSGDMRIEFMPKEKLETSLSVSARLSVKLSPDTRTPKRNGGLSHGSESLL